MILSKDTQSQDVIKIIKRAGKPLLENIELIDRFEGGQLEEGKCSHAYRLWFRSKTKTLTEMDVKPVHDNIRKELIRALSAELRS